MAPKLDRIPFQDERSKNYSVSRSLKMVKRRDITWKMPAMMPLDQGQEGACVGFGWSAELASAPVQYAVSNAFARRLYTAAQSEDRAMGQVYDDGASVLAGAKAVKRMGVVGTYEWAFGTEQVIDTLVQKGPVVLGVNWYSDMYETDVSGLVKIGGELVGGHCITAFGYRKMYCGEECVVWMNSWGATYGIGGVGYLPVSGLDRLLKENGEACIATDIVRR
jgi:hypothetical protein